MIDVRFFRESKISSSAKQQFSILKSHRTFIGAVCQRPPSMKIQVNLIDMYLFNGPRTNQFLFVDLENWATRFRLKMEFSGAGSKIYRPVIWIGLSKIGILAGQDELQLSLIKGPVENDELIKVSGGAYWPDIA
ncbi:MAG: hypothetical protein QF437_11530 [Planctomycetota bacterium]|nr:hypothetical protein [Planctomycetota bacterium]